MRILSIALAMLLAACTSSRRAEGPALAHAAGWPWEIVSAGTFDLAVALAPRTGSDTLVAYIEGDGLAYMRANQPATDPTPTDPTALRMALADPTTAPVVWIGRPCQYTQPERGRNCGQAYWTIHRYAPAVLDSLGIALDALKQRTGTHRLVLVGYSGGGALAALLSAHRTDVDRIVTVAANLDLDYWTTRDGLAPLAGSLDPARFADRLGAVRQTHYAGGEDRTVGTDVTRSFMRRLPPGTQARLIEVPHFTHGCCWARDWRAMISADR